MIRNTLFIFVASLLVYGCSTGNSGIGLNDFENAVSTQAGRDAIDCGALADPNLCISEGFNNSTAAFVVNIGQGTDSLVASGVAVKSNARVFFMSFDSDPSGGGSLNNGRITTSECINPQSSQTGLGAFACDEIRNAT